MNIENSQWDPYATLGLRDDGSFATDKINKVHQKA